jgi:RNA polymerase sigma-70 factor (ECF subfamily)
VRLRVLEDLEYSDIARELGTTPAAARVRVHRGLKALKRHLTPFKENKA